MPALAIVPRRIPSPFPQWPDAYVVLPPEWLGEHCIRRDAAIKAAEKYNSPQITRLCISLVLTDEFSLPGLSGADPDKWDLSKTPLPLIAWLEVVVFNDFVRAFIIPKAFSLESPSGSAATPTTTNPTAGT